MPLAGSIGFDVAIDATNEYSASSVPERPTHYAEGDAEYNHVTGGVRGQEPDARIR